MTDRKREKPPQPRGFVINIIYNGITKPLRIQPSDTVQAVLQRRHGAIPGDRAAAPW